MTRLLAIVASVFLTQTLVGQEPKDPKPEPPKQEKEEAKQEPKSEKSKEAREILKKADEATKKVQSVKYNGTFAGTGGLASQAPKAKYTAIISGKVKNQTDLYAKARFEVKMTLPGSDKTSEFTVITDGENFTLIDPETKTVHTDIDPAVLGRRGGMVLGQGGIGIGMREFAHPTPFGDEINGDAHELRGTKDVAGEKCNVVYVKYAGGQGEAVWYFSAKDNLPRRVERIVSQRNGNIELELADLTLDPKVSDDTFKPAVPEGHKKSDESAP